MGTGVNVPKESSRHPRQRPLCGTCLLHPPTVGGRYLSALERCRAPMPGPPLLLQFYPCSRLPKSPHGQQLESGPSNCRGQVCRHPSNRKGLGECVY